MSLKTQSHILSMIPTIWEARLLEHLKPKLVVGQLYNSDYADQLKPGGDTVRINRMKPLQVEKIDRYDKIPTQQLSSEFVDLVIDTQTGGGYDVYDIDVIQSVGSVIDTSTRSISNSAAIMMENDLLNGLRTGAEAKLKNKKLTPENIYKTFSDIGVMLTRGMTPTTGRTALVSPEILGMLQQAKVFSETGGALAESVLVNGFAGRVLTMNVISSPLLADQEIIFGHSEGASYIVQATMSDSERIAGKFATKFKMAQFYGSVIIEPSFFVAVNPAEPEVTV